MVLRGEFIITNIEKQILNQQLALQLKELEKEQTKHRARRGRAY